MKLTTSLALAALAVSSLSPAAHADTRVQKTFGSWQVDCNENDQGKKGCALQYSLVAKKDRRPIFSWNIIKGQKDGDPNKAVIRTPTGVLLADGVNIGFEGAEPVKIAYLACGPQACVAEFDFTEQWSKALSGNDNVKVNITTLGKKPIKYDIDLKQFSAAYEYFNSQVADK